MEKITYKEKILFIDNADLDLNDWESKFIESVIEKEKDCEFTEKQKSIINKLYLKSSHEFV